MTADHVDIAEAVRQSLDGHTFSQHMSAVRRYVDTIQRELVDEAEAVVMPAGETVEFVSREMTGQHDYIISIVVRANVDVDRDEFSTRQIDGLILLGEEIKDHLRDAGQMASATLIGFQHEPLWDSDILHESHTWLTNILATYRLFRNGA